MAQNDNPSKIHLVGPDDIPGSPHPNKRIEIGHYFADILEDKRTEPELFHWIVQKRGSAEIIHWGHENSFQSAVTEATYWLQSLFRREQFRQEKSARRTDMESKSQRDSRQQG